MREQIRALRAETDGRRILYTGDWAKAKTDQASSPNRGTNMKKVVWFAAGIQKFDGGHLAE
jgi:hypothetical protein